MPEFELIKRLQEAICASSAPYQGRCVLGIGDDAALMNVPAGRQLVACTDSLVEGVHFPADTPPAAVGHKALAVNLSDLAAMGAEPAWFLLALTLPSADADWLDGFAAGMSRLARESGIFLAGGDVTSGPLNICVTAMGLVEPGQALTRSGARPGDLVVVSGRPGAAAHALQVMHHGGEADPSERTALDYPAPRLGLGRALRGLSTSCIDLSDGLLADLGHLLESAGVGAQLELQSLPCPPSMSSLPERERWPMQLSGGDDYELCFTLPSSRRSSVDDLARSCGVELTVIGEITGGDGLVARQPDGSTYQPRKSGYEHFREDGAGLS
jgi:thiamine-monophosphate kinase